VRTEAVEDYLKSIYELEQQQQKVSTTALAEHLNVTPASATGMIKKLAELNLVGYERYQGVSLTEAGRKIALEVIRHHRLVELYLAEALNVPWDKVHAEAEKWEHILSEELENRMDEALGYPTSDPHGAPIPSRDGRIERIPCIPLAELPIGQVAEIVEVSDHDPELLRYLGQMHLYPQTKIELRAAAPFDGPLTIALLPTQTEYTLGRAIAQHIFVAPTPPPNKA
jgi:DtxR family Mn-dependent transcriptional regulator